ncbi:NrdJb, partial [Photobacterium damselae subsp. damselae]|nr:NrdJb [Photobacterium damselae subsp. damselae]
PLEQMHESMPRPEKLVGATYKLKTPEHISEHSLFITINDVVLNEGTEHEIRRPFEVFINSKSLEHYQWIVALTRIMSAVFRKGGDCTFLVEELRSVFDPKGGYWNQGKYVPSLIAEIGNIIEMHLIEIGMINKPELDQHQQAFIDAKKAELSGNSVSNEQEQTDSNFPPSATLCYKCHAKAVVVKDGCQTCLNCGDSKCG